MAKKGFMQQPRQGMVVLGEGLGMLNRLLSAGASHGDNTEDHVVGSFIQQTDTHSSSNPPPPRSLKDIMSVQLNPSSSLGFRRPLTTLVKRSLVITNNNSQPVAFKVKTTAPKLYCVRPNSGRVEPGESVDVSVMLQALKEEPQLNAKCKDKFLIQSTIITPDKDTMSLADIWASPDTNEEGKVFQQKLRVTYLPAEGQPVEEEDENTQVGMTSLLSNDDGSHYDTVRRSVANGHHTDSQFLAASSHLPQDRAPTPNYDSVVHQDSQDSTSTSAGQQLPIIIEPQLEQHSVSPVPPPFVNNAVVDEPAPEQPVDETTEPEPEPAYSYTQPPPAPPEPVIITRENPINEELYAKYNKALLDLDNMQVLVTSLQEQLKQSQGVESAAADAPPVQVLRRRTRKLSDADSAAYSEVATMVDEAPIQQEGVPLNVVVIIALGVFVTTYLFF